MKRKIARLSFILAATSLVVFSACEKDKTPPNPSASFEMTNNYMKAPIDVKLTNTSQNASTYLWDFGDTTTSTETSPTHTYDKKGLYNIKLTVKNEDGKSTSSSSLLKVYGNITSWSPGRIELLPEAWAEEVGENTIYMSVWDANNNLYDYKGDGKYSSYSGITEDSKSLIFGISNAMTLPKNSDSKVTIKFQLFDGGEYVNPTIDPIVYQVVINGSDVLPTEAVGPYKQVISKDDKVDINIVWAD